ncbi:MAG: hypothetical protein L6V90_05365 [Treponema succinifaciens]|nr:MAG: hypothetical protein L6V90_05365 [Treponema succinifaciens]
MSAAIDNIKKAHTFKARTFRRKKLSAGNEVSVKVIKKSWKRKLHSFSARRKNQRKKQNSACRRKLIQSHARNRRRFKKIILKTLSEQKAADVFPRTLLEFLNSAGIESDSVVLKTVQQMIQSGVKLDKSIIRKAKSISSLFPGKGKKQAAEISAMLMEKKESSRKKNLIEKNFCFLTDPGKWKNSSNKEKNIAKSTENFLKKIYKEIPENKDGILTLANHIKSKDGTGKHWIILPFLWQLEKDEAKGLIRILIDF